MAEWRICDATLREGLQSGLPLFAADRAEIAYAETVLGAGLADAVEVFRPGEHLSSETLDALIARWGARIRVYCGVAHRLHHIPSRATSISVTLLDSRREAGIDLVRALADERPRVAVRVGLECVSRWGAVELEQTIRTLETLTNVDCISLCDSIGELLPGDLRAMATSISAVLGEVPLGGHFHDDAGLATANVAGFLDGSRGRCEVDVTLAGVGERVGIPSLESVSALRAGTSWTRERRDVFVTLRALAGGALGDFDKTPLSGGSHVADSHLTPNGELREEYRNLY